jgi:hypothetical protein
MKCIMLNVDFTGICQKFDRSQHARASICKYICRRMQVQGFALHL